MKIVKIRAVNFLLIRPDNKVLLQLRDNNTEKSPNMWNIPGGKIEEGESEIDAVIRECEEETGVILGRSQCVPSIVFSYTIPEGTFMNKLYLCGVGYVAYEVREGQDMQWFDLNEVSKLDLPCNENYLIPHIKHYIWGR